MLTSLPFVDFPRQKHAKLVFRTFFTTFPGRFSVELPQIFLTLSRQSGWPVFEQDPNLQED